MIVMQPICLSISHHNTPVELRECLSLSTEKIENAARSHKLRGGNYEALKEMVVLSTCNRLEVYSVAALSDGQEGRVDIVWDALHEYLDSAFQIPVDRIRPYIHFYTGIQAVEHLFNVTAGLDSIAIGETQILGQVSHAFDFALRLGTARHILSSMFRAAIHAGRQIHSGSNIGQHPINLSMLAVDLAEEQLGALDECKILVVGAGKMGAYALDALRSRGLPQVFLTNRTRERASELAARMGGSVLPFEQLFDSLADADLVFTSTAAPQPILHENLVAQVMARRPQRRLTLVDLAVPRNVSPDVKRLPNVRFYDMDDLQAFARRSPTSSPTHIARAEAILQQQVAEYAKLLQIMPLIGELHKKVEVLRQREVEKTLRQLHNPDPLVSERIEILSRSLVRKILHEPTMHLRMEADQENLSHYAGVISRLFDLHLSEMEFLAPEEKS
jgi:glutamyl-tRNA reductase